MIELPAVLGGGCQEVVDAHDHIAHLEPGALGGTPFEHWHHSRTRRSGSIETPKPAKGQTGW